MKSLAFAVLLFSVLALGIGASTVTLSGCGCTEVGCESGVRASISSTSIPKTSSLAIHATFAGKTFDAQVDLRTPATPKCATTTMDMCQAGSDNGSLAIELVFDSEYSDDSATVDLSVTTSEG